ncbi:hypothetical protein [Shewanella saliphila]|uniref:Uncharacterized protein n=1 Tax=Shewanella saliphila TaxID=2282698 RepID=A0ABQ2QAE8_9GAMM|nr:hypothetical protein [Shewanella saliphila]MCL1100883.1 hypothetical protein [Shewanella saliphila]GGP60444.1 hypothetical protein GCM10009409_27900 [Shewanella saliphila]
MQNNIKQVSSLPSDIIVNAEQFVIVYKKRMFWYVIPAFSYFLMPESLDILAVMLLGGLYAYVFFFSSISKLLWHFDRVLWCQLFISLAIGLGAIVFLRLFDLTHWLIHSVGFVPDGEVKHIFAIIAFTPLVAAYVDSFKKVELAFYKSKGYNYIGLLGNLNGM